MAIGNGAQERAVPWMGPGSKNERESPSISLLAVGLAVIPSRKWPGSTAMPACKWLFSNV
jgi:hypothetical protein